MVNTRSGYHLDKKDINTFVTFLQDISGFANHSVAEPSNHLQRSVKSFLEALSELRGQKFMVTERGFLGLVPELCRRGDVIVLLDGAPRPYVLRPVMDSAAGERYFLFVGGCHVNQVVPETEECILLERCMMGRSDVSFNIR